MHRGDPPQWQGLSGLEYSDSPRTSGPFALPRQGPRFRSSQPTSPSSQHPSFRSPNLTVPAPGWSPSAAPSMAAPAQEPAVGRADWDFRSPAPRTHAISPPRRRVPRGLPTGHNQSRARSACEALRGRPAARPGRNRRDDRREPASPGNLPDGAPDQRPWPARAEAGFGPCGNCAGRGHTPKTEPPRSPNPPSRSMGQSARQPSLVRRPVNRLPAPSAQQAPCRPESRRTLVKISESGNANPAGRAGHFLCARPAVQ
jgi:hypothetical protein